MCKWRPNVGIDNRGVASNSIRVDSNPREGRVYPSVSIPSQFRSRDDVVSCDNSETVDEPVTTRLCNVSAQGSCGEQPFSNFKETSPTVMGGDDCFRPI